MHTTESKFKTGDVITRKEEDGSWCTFQVLEISEWDNYTNTLHCLVYESAEAKPNLSDLVNMNLLAEHAPICEENFKAGWEFIGNKKLSNKDLSGYVEYLKLTNFAKYVEYTHQDLDTIISAANSHYSKGYNYTSEGKKNEAIEEYTKAIELFPLLYEAIDNRAFVHITLGQFEAALQDFDLSLMVNPNGFHAFFSKGECLLKLKKYHEAAEIFQKGISLFPEKKELFEDFYKKSKE